MDTRASKAPPGAGLHALAQAERSWPWIASLWLAFFLARALVYLSVFPPLEGWDEHQHLGYVAWLDEHGSIPVLGRSEIPASLQPLLVSLPHPQFGFHQTQLWGAASYETFWERDEPSGPGATVDAPAALPVLGLYQAQHPPLAYALALPVWRAFGPERQLAAIYALRGLNVLLVAAGLAVFAWSIRDLLPGVAERTAVLALVCCHPLFLQNAARVANDALAIATGLAGISLLFLRPPSSLHVRAALAGACIALSIWSKQTGLTLVPALLTGVPLLAGLGGETRRRIITATLTAAAALVVGLLPLFAWNWQHYGSIVTTQEAVKLAEEGRGLEDVLGGLPHLDWPTLAHKLFVPGTGWVGGWSHVRANELLADAHGWCFGLLVAAAGIGWLRHGQRSRAGDRLARAGGASQPRPGGGFIVCAVVVATVAGGMIYHAVVSRTLFGAPTTNVWYFMTALPFLLLLVVRGLTLVHERLMMVGSALLVSLFLALETHGLLGPMPRFYADSANGPEIWARLGAIHPMFPHPGQRWFFLALEAGLLAVVSWRTWEVFRGPRAALARKT